MGTDKTGDAENAAIATVFRNRKEELGLNFEQLATMTGFSVRTVKRYLHDERLLRIRDVRSLSSALDMTLIEVFTKAELS